MGNEQRKIGDPSYLLSKRLDEILGTRDTLANDGSPDSRDHKSDILVFAVGKSEAGADSGAVADAFNDSCKKKKKRIE